MRDYKIERVNNASGEFMCIVRWQADTPSGWVGAYDKEAFDALLAQARADALEEAAKVCDERAAEWWDRAGGDAARRCAFLIRALKEERDE